MKRFVLDMLLVLVIVSIISSLSSDNSSISFDEQIKDFEQQVDNGLIYQPNKEVHLLQIEENHAGKLGSSLSNFVVNVFTEGASIVKEIVKGMD